MSSNITSSIVTTTTTTTLNHVLLFAASASFDDWNDRQQEAAAAIDSHIATTAATHDEGNNNNSKFPSSSIELSMFLLVGTQKYILEGCFIMSTISLVISFLVYCIVPELRTVPGKCLMGLIVSELFTHLSVIAAMQHPWPFPACFAIGVCVHYFFLTTVSWTSVIGK